MWVKHNMMRLRREKILPNTFGKIEENKEITLTKKRFWKFNKNISFLMQEEQNRLIADAKFLRNEQ